jgi:DNA polymerase elongation subunit (family B)
VASTFGVKTGQYVSIYYNDGITDNNVGDKKYHILKLGTESKKNEKGETKSEPFIDVDDCDLNLQEYLNKQFKVYWCQAKDDVSPKQIFESYEGTANQRAIVGKYCIQDCELCNRLIGKLSVLINNIGMANVCTVPLNYLFLRGQGVKIFSLVSKQCREENHLIPVIQKKNKKTPEELEKEAKENNNFQKFVNYLSNKGDDSEEEDDEDDEGYEGATVFEPVTGVHYKPIPVLDYASLYPNSMILKNLSHESHVMDDKYDNLPGYNYHEIKYKKNSYMYME